MKIPLSRPDIASEDIEAVLAVLKTPHLSLGPATAVFESAVASYVGAEHAVAVSSGTAGLHCLVRAMGIGEGDDVVTTPFSFIASAHALLYEGARPVFADIDPQGYGLDPAAVEAVITPATRAILAVHVFGRPCRISEMRELARKRGLLLLEDACEALGTTAGGEHTGTFGQGGVYAFYPNKQVTTGEGGMIVTSDGRLAALCRSLRNQGRSGAGASGWVEHERLGYNYRLSDILCALGASQLSRIERSIAARESLFGAYGRRLAGIPGVTLPDPPRPGERISWFAYVIRLSDGISRADRDAVLSRLGSTGIECRNYFVPIHLQPFYRERFGFREGDFPVAESISARTIALPFHNRLTLEEIDFVASTLEGSLRKAP